MTPVMPEGWVPEKGMLVDLPYDGAVLSPQRHDDRKTWTPAEETKGLWVVVQEWKHDTHLYYLLRPEDTPVARFATKELILYPEEIYPYITQKSAWQKWLETGTC